MDIFFTINALISLGIFLYLISNFFKHYSKKVSKLTHTAVIIGIGFIIISFISFLWAFDFVKYDYSDYFLIYTIVLLINSIVLFRIVYFLIRKKQLNYILFFYLLGFSAIFSKSFNFLHLISSISFLLILILFVILGSKSRDYEKQSYYGIFYAAVSLIFQFLLFYSLENVFIFSLVSNSLFLVFIVSFIEEIKNNPPHIEREEKKEDNYFLTFIKHFVFIAIITTFIFIGTIGLHEFGHYTLSKLYDCGERRIIFEDDYAHTEILCTELPNKEILISSAIIFPFLVAIALFIIGGKFIKEMSSIIIGFNFIASYKDFINLGFSENIGISATILGVIFLIIGIIYLAKSKTEETFFE